MASRTIARPDLYPDGTVLSAYQARQVRRTAVGYDIVGAAVATATVASGTATLSGLADGTTYTVLGTVGGTPRPFRFRTDETSTGLAPLRGSSTNPDGTPLPSWRKRRRALGLGLL